MCDSGGYYGSSRWGTQAENGGQPKHRQSHGKRGEPSLQIEQIVKFLRDVELGLQWQFTEASYNASAVDSCQFVEPQDGLCL
jgi:hypothetical protein